MKQLIDSALIGRRRGPQARLTDEIRRAVHAGAPYVQVRAYDHGDEAAVRGMRLSNKSLYERFFAGTPRIPAHYTGALNRIDHWDREAVIAVAGTEILGVAEYIRDKTALGQADLAVMVADPWQRRGIARRLVTALVELARIRGISELRADVLVSNAAAQSAIRSGWPCACATRGDGGTVTYRLAVASAEGA